MTKNNLNKKFCIFYIIRLETIILPLLKKKYNMCTFSANWQDFHWQFHIANQWFHKDFIYYTSPLYVCVMFLLEMPCLENITWTALRVQNITQVYNVPCVFTALYRIKTTLWSKVHCPCGPQHYFYKYY